MPVRSIPYEIVGDGIPIASAFFAEIDAARTAQFAIAKDLGASAMRPTRGGTIGSLFFDALPEGFRRVGSENGKIEAAPRLNTKIGKAAASRLKEAPKAPSPEALAEKFGWSGEFIIDGGSVYHATGSRVRLPNDRFFVTLPRQPDDGFETPSTLKEILQSEYEAAFHEHNLLAAQRRAA